MKRFSIRLVAVCAMVTASMIVSGWNASAEDCEKAIPFVGNDQCLFCVALSGGTSIECLAGPLGYGEQQDCEDTNLAGFSCELNAEECGGTAFLDNHSNNCTGNSVLIIDVGPCSDNEDNVFLHPQAWEATGGAFNCNGGGGGPV